MAIALQQKQLPAKQQKATECGHLTVSAQLIPFYLELPEVIRIILEKGKQQSDYVFCTEEELIASPRAIWSYRRRADEIP